MNGLLRAASEKFARTPGTPAAPSRSSTDQSSPSHRTSMERRTVLLGVAGLSTMVPQEAKASKLGAVGDSIWENAFGGGPADLFYPDSWEGTWDCQSTLTKIDLPFGESYVPNMNTVRRAERADLNQTIAYPVRFIRNAQGKVISDRAFNTAALVELYMGQIQGMNNRIDWDSNDPNVLNLRLPGGLSIRTRVTRRSEEIPDASANSKAQRLETSEYFEQVFDDPNQLQPRVKASQCFTKYIYRSKEEARGGPEIVATQIVGDFLTSFDDEKLLLASMNKPVTIYTYKMSFIRQA